MNTQQRMDLLAELAETVQGTIRGGWMDYLQVEKEGHPLEGVQLRCRWMDDGTMILEHGGEDILRVLIQVEVSYVEDGPAPVNEPIGGEIPSQWNKVPAGWFVKTPKGDWLEVGQTSFTAATGKQMVSLKVGDAFHVFPRDPKGEVWARRGSLAPRDLSDAMASLEEAFTTAILHDEPPGQS